MACYAFVLMRSRALTVIRPSSPKRKNIRFRGSDFITGAAETQTVSVSRGHLSPSALPRRVLRNEGKGEKRTEARTEADQESDSSPSLSGSGLQGHLR